MDLELFRTHFPEFADTTKYPDAVLTYWSGFITTRLNVDRWADALDYGVELATAHYVKLITDSDMSGVLTSKSVGDVSASYDIASTIEGNAGHWNSTKYGKLFVNLARIIGVGGAQL
jgi:hypothetical protein